MPIANASILVAIAIVNTTFGFAGLNSLQHSSSLKDSKIIRPPKKAKDRESNPMVYTFYKMTECLCTHPSDKWHDCLKKAESKKAMISMGFQRVRFKIIPLAIETAKQSIARPIASSQISSPVIVF